MPRKMGNDKPEDKPEEAKFNYSDHQAEVDKSLAQTSDEIQQLIDASSTDNAVKIDDVDDKPFFKDPEEGQKVEPIPTEEPKDTGYVLQEDPGMTLNSPDLYDGRGFDPAIQIREKGKNEFNDGKTSSAKAKAVADSGIVTTKTSKPATEIDLATIDESQIMNLPQIKAASFEIIDILNPRPKSPSIRFKWANYKNAVAGNLGKLKALGFEVAHTDDIDMAKSHIDPSMVDGTQVKYYDVVLMKIDTIRLMSLYKANILRSVSKLARVREKGIKEAENDFRSSVASVPGASHAYNKMKEALGGKEPVQFFVPTE